MEPQVFLVYQKYGFGVSTTNPYLAFAAAVCSHPFALGKMRAPLIARMRIQKISGRAGAPNDAAWVQAMAREYEQVCSNAGDHSGASGWRELADQADHGTELLRLWGGWREAISEANRLAEVSDDPLRDFYVWVTRRNNSTKYLTLPG